MEMTQRELLCAHDGYRKRIEEQWEMVRLQSYYAVSPYAPKRFKISDVWIPADESKVDKRKPGTRKVLAREELKQLYKKSGIAISEKRLDEIYGAK